MALVKCKECGKDVSNTAKTCPHCGAPVPKSQFGCGTVIVLATVAVIAFIMIEMPTTSTRSDPPSQQSPAASRPSPDQRQPAAAPETADSDEGSVLFRLVDEQHDDLPGKAQVNQQVLIVGEVTADNVRAELQRRFREASLTRGWRYHARPTNVYIYIYQTEERAREAGPHWVGMLDWTSHGGATPPRIQVREDSLGAPTAAPAGVEAWRDDRTYVAGVLWFERSESGHVIKRRFDGGGDAEWEVIAVEDPRGRRFNVVGGDDYYIINRAGDLEIHDNDGLIDTARKIER